MLTVLSVGVVDANWEQVDSGEAVCSRNEGTGKRDSGLMELNCRSQQYAENRNAWCPPRRDFVEMKR